MTWIDIRMNTVKTEKRYPNICKLLQKRLMLPLRWFDVSFSRCSFSILGKWTGLSRQEPKPEIIIKIAIFVSLLVKVFRDFGGQAKNFLIVLKTQTEQQFFNGCMLLYGIVRHPFWTKVEL